MNKDLAIRGAAGLTPALQEAGVQIETSTDGRYRAITFPPDLRDKFNLLLPTEEIVQADPNYTPTIRAVRLDPDPVNGSHFYKQQGNRLAPTKQALETLADTAGIRVAKTRLMTRSELDSYPPGSIGYEATLILRRSDGTSKEITAHKVWDPEVERYRIEGEVADAAKKNNWVEAQAKAELRKRLLFEKTHGGSKTESKALLRAIRSALQIPQGFTPQDAAKPFIVVGYSFTPDYDDPEVRRLLIERGYSQSSAVYGRPPELGGSAPHVRTVEAEGHAASSARDGGGAVASRPPAPPSPTPEAGADAAQASPAAEQAASETSDHQGAGSGAFAGEEPRNDTPGPGAFMLGEEFTRYAGKTLAEVDDPEYLAWLSSDAVGEPTRSAARIFLTFLDSERTP